jgi:signal transduction histidine kinase
VECERRSDQDARQDSPGASSTHPTLASGRYNPKVTRSEREAVRGEMEASALTDERRVFLSTLPAGRGARRRALAAVLVSVAVFLAAAPFAKLPLAQIGAFIPIYESALVINDLITAVLLFGQFGILRSRALLVLACGYLLTAFMAVAHALTFPGLFSPTGLVGAGPQSTAWLYMFWHGGFPLLVIAYALLKGEARDTTGAATGMAVLASVAAVLVAVCGLTLLATAGQNALPAIMQGNHYTPAMIVVVSSVWVLSLVALVVLGRRRPHSVLDLWLMVVMCAWIFDIALSAVLNAGRFDLGFYAGRIYGLLAASFVLIVLLLENSVLYSRLVEAHESERRKTAELLAANKDLDAFSHSVAHDLRSPLRAVDGYARMLEEAYAGGMDAEGRRLLGVVRASSQLMGRLIDALLDFARLGRQPLKTRPVELDELVNQVIDELRANVGGRSIEFAVGKLGTTVADPALLKQVLANLLGNAIKFTRDRNPAVVEVGCRKEAETGATNVYYVKDNGAGFDMRYSDKLFGVFQRLHRADEYEGTGVGLSIVQRVIIRHGGRVWADSRPGEGATFYFTLQSGS